MSGAARTRTRLVAGASIVPSRVPRITSFEGSSESWATWAALSASADEAAEATGAKSALAAEAVSSEGSVALYGGNGKRN